MNKKIISRLLLFFLGVPLCLFIALWNFGNHLPMHILTMSVALIGALELYDILNKNTPLLPKTFVVLGTALLLLAASLYKVLPAFLSFAWPFGDEILTYVFLGLVIVFLSVEVFTAKDFKDSITRITSSVFVLIYCGFLPTFVSRLTTAKVGQTDFAGPLILIFLLMVFLCDSLAWFFGVLLGKNNRGFVKASPNKSIAGFIGGVVGSILAGVVGYFVWKDSFDAVKCSLLKTVVIGLLVSVSSIVGDLVESVLKRSAGVKDSGRIVMGRGGMLDSIDSILLAAPVYYFCVYIFMGSVFS